MLRIRLTRTGRKNLAQYRIVVAEHKAPIKGRFIEIIGSFNPRLEEKDGLKINDERLKYWISVGAKPTDTVTNLLVDAGIFDAKQKIKKTSKKKTKEKEEKPEKPEVIESPAQPQAQEGSPMEMPTEDEAEKKEMPKETPAESPTQTQKETSAVPEPKPKEKPQEKSDQPKKA